MPKYRVEFLIDKQVIAAVETTAKTVEDAETKASKLIKTRTKNV